MQSLLPIYPGAPHCPPKPYEFASSDYVCVELDAEVFEMLQQMHGGWNSAMANVSMGDTISGLVSAFSLTSHVKIYLDPWRAWSGPLYRGQWRSTGVLWTKQLDY